jgi:hypothetical protein
VQQRRAFRDRRLRRGDGGQQLVFHFDRLKRIDCLIARFGNDRRDSIADKAHLVVGQRHSCAGDVLRVRREMGFDAAGNPDAGQRLHASDQVFPGDDFQHAGHLLRRAGVD